MTLKSPQLSAVNLKCLPFSLQMVNLYTHFNRLLTLRRLLNCSASPESCTFLRQTALVLKYHYWIRACAETLWWSQLVVSQSFQSLHMTGMGLFLFPLSLSNTHNTLIIIVFLQKSFCKPLFLYILLRKNQTLLPFFRLSRLLDIGCCFTDFQASPHT